MKYKLLEEDQINELKDKDRNSRMSKNFADESLYGYEKTDEFTKKVISIEQMIIEYNKNKEFEDNESNRELKWQFAAIVIDRFFFYLTILYSVITFIIFVLAIPNFYRFT
jgi:hypothetical protein